MLELKNQKAAVPIVWFAGLFWSLGPYVVRNIDAANTVPWQYLFTRGIVIFLLLNCFLYFEEGIKFYKIQIKHKNLFLIQKHEKNPTKLSFLYPSNWGDTYNTNQNGESIMAILFASIDKISKIGNYSGNGSSGQTISTGFQPRFLMIRRVDTASNWLILDTTRGWGSGDDKYMLLNGSGAQGDYEVGAPVSNGFTLVGDNDYNQNTKQYIYYAHA